MIPLKRQGFLVAVVTASIFAGLLGCRSGDEVAELGGTTKEDGNWLLQAAAEGNLRTVELLVNKGVDINYRSTTGRKFTALLWAVFERNYRIADFLLQRGADPTLTDVQGMSPLDFVNGDNSSEGEKFAQTLQSAVERKR